MSAPTRTSKRKANKAAPGDTGNGAAAATSTTAPSRSTPSILTPGPSASTSASIPSSLHQSAFSIPVRASSPQSSQSLAALPPLPLPTSVFSSAAPSSSSTVGQVDHSKEQQTEDEDEVDSPDSNAVDDSQQRGSKKLKSEQGATDSGASPGPSSSPGATTKKQPEPELSDAAKHVLFERRWSPQHAYDWSSSSALSLHLSWQKLIDQLQQQFGVRWTKKKLADAADHAKKVYVDRRKAARLPGHRTPQPWKWHQLMDQWLGPQMNNDVKDEADLSAPSSATSQPSLLPPPPAVSDASKTAGARGPAPSLAGSGSASMSATGSASSSAMDGALNHALYALVQDSQRRHEELARAHSDKLDRLLALVQTVADRLPAKAD